MDFYRRLDYPVLQAPTTAVQEAGGKVPVRMTYPVREQSVNVLIGLQPRQQLEVISLQQKYFGINFN